MSIYLFLDVHSRPMQLTVFDHIPKTAGTTFAEAYLKVALPASAQWILRGGAENEQDRQRFLALPIDVRAPIRIVAGHYAEGLRPHLPHARFVTVIREPVSRAISSYLHALYHRGPEDLWPDVRRDRLTLSDYVARYTSNVADYQSRVLLGDDYASLDDDGIVNRLNARYALVGCTEAFDSFIFGLHQLDGLPLALYTNRLVRPERATYVPSETDIAAVRACTAADARLYRIVKTSGDAALGALPSGVRKAHAQFLRKLEKFRARNPNRRRGKPWSPGQPDGDPKTS